MPAARFTKVALVTGASSGNGQATAARLAEAGYRVFGTSRRSAGDHGPVEMLSLDVTSDASVRAVLEAVVSRAGRIDLLVNNAGFGVAPAAAEESSIEQAKAIFDTNFFGIVRMTRAVLPLMALYAATKHAIEGYSESVDHEVRTRGIRVSVIEPAYTKTPFDAHLVEPDAALVAYGGCGSTGERPDHNAARNHGS